MSWQDKTKNRIYFPPEIKCQCGEVLELPLLAQVENLAGLKLILIYDQDLLSFKNLHLTKLSSSLMHILNSKQKGRIILVMAGAKGIQVKNKAIAKLYFKVKEECPAPIRTIIQINAVQVLDSKLKNIKVQTNKGLLLIQDLK